MTKKELIDHLQHLEQYTHYSEDAPALREVIEMLTERGERTETHACDFENLPSAQSEQTDCEYCHEDGDGYVTPLEKNCHAVVWCSPIDGWVLSVKYGSWRKDVPIRFCPMCGRRLPGRR